MKRFLLLAGAVLLVGLGAAWAMQNAQENSDKSKEAAGDYKISAGDAPRVNPVKSSAEGLAEARKVLGYDYDMCQGRKKARQVNERPRRKALHRCRREIFADGCARRQRVGQRACSQCLVPGLGH